MSLDFDEVARVLALYAADPAQAARLRRAYPEIGEACAIIYGAPTATFNLDPCPAPSTLSTHQVTVYDNHLTKKSGNRWGVSLKVYQGDRIDLAEPAWQASAFLWPKNKIKDELRQICRSRNVHPFPEEGRDEFTQIVDLYDYEFWGVLKVKEPNGPSFHFTSHYVAMNFENGRPVNGAIFLPGMTEPHLITDFASSPVKGKFPGRAVAQSRQSSSPELFGWVYPPRGNRGALI